MRFWQGRAAFPGEQASLMASRTGAAMHFPDSVAAASPGGGEKARSPPGERRWLPDSPERGTEDRLPEKGDGFLEKARWLPGFARIFPEKNGDGFPGIGGNRFRKGRCLRVGEMFRSTPRSFPRGKIDSGGGKKELFFPGWAPWEETDLWGAAGAAPAAYFISPR